MAFFALGIGTIAWTLACESEKFCAAGSVECSGGTTTSGSSGKGGGTATGGASGRGGADKGGSAGTSSASGGSGAEAGVGMGAGPGSGGASGEGGSDGNSGGAAGDAGFGGEEGEGGAGGNGETCDPSLSPSEESCLVSDDYAIFVSPIGDDDDDGTQAEPVLTLHRALALGREQQKIVIACSTEGSYPQSLSIDADLDGARLYGGFGCESWEHFDENVTEVESPDPIALRVDQLAEGLVIEDFAFTASDAGLSGQSSMGAFITASQNVRLRRVKLSAGKGAPGEDGTGTSTEAEPGAAGIGGVAACIATVEPNPGAPAVQTRCGGVASGSIGGRGGDGGTEGRSAGNGDAGLPDSEGGEPGFGQSTADWECSTSGAGRAGSSGATGASGKGGSGAGSLTRDGYLAMPGENGENGEPGQGGGGGGGAKAPAATCAISLNIRTGASGGSGGGGGCGGKGGTGGKGGGASIALAAVDSSVTLEQVELFAQEGGRGGNGGSAQPGGAGGQPGPGASGGGLGTKNSCSGGIGGEGGDGGHGGGGAGGASLGIAWVGMEPEQRDVSFEIAESSAPGGTDGSASSQGEGAGDPGVVATVREL